MAADDFTDREWDIVTLLTERYTNKEIADRLEISEATVKKHISNILSKLGASNRREAIHIAYNQGLLTDRSYIINRNQLVSSGNSEVNDVSTDNKKPNVDLSHLLINEPENLDGKPHLEIEHFERDWTKKKKVYISSKKVAPLALKNWLRLTRRQRQIALLISTPNHANLSAYELSILLGITEKTVKKHLQNIYRKLGVSTRAGTTMKVVYLVRMHEIYLGLRGREKQWAEDMLRSIEGHIRITSVEI